MTAPWVPTGMKTGVRITPWGVTISPARPRPEGARATTLKTMLTNGSPSRDVQTVPKPLAASLVSPQDELPHKISIASPKLKNLYLSLTAIS